MKSKIITNAARAFAVLLSVGVALSPTFVASAGHAASKDPKYRATSAPRVFYPVTGTRSVKDLQDFSPRHHWTDIKANCGAGVRATHPGVAHVWPSRGGYLIRVTGQTGVLATYYTYLSRPWVSNGQIIQSGQWIGTVGRHPVSKVCDLAYSVASNNRWANPTSWLNYYVGRMAPISRLFDTTSFNVASFNVLGATHTRGGGRFGTAATRTPKALKLINDLRLDVVGLQELQDEQKAQLLSLSGNTFGIFHWRGRATGPGDTDNSIIWRDSTMELVSTDTFDIPYFGGHTRHVPIVLLRQRETGRTAYFLNVHNPANVQGPAQQWRDKAIAIERAKIIELRATGRPVFLTGDFNDRQAAFCPLTANKLTISPNSIPSTGCAYPKPSSIDWIFAAGQTRFTSFDRDTYPQQARISDHPIVVARAYLQD